jgi:hypothetical protein
MPLANPHLVSGQVHHHQSTQKNTYPKQCLIVFNNGEMAAVLRPVQQYVFVTGTTMRLPTQALTCNTMQHAPWQHAL